MDSWLYIWRTRRAADSPSISSPNDFCDRPQGRIISPPLDRRCPLSRENWPGCIKNQCVIVVTVLVKHGTVDEKYSKGGSFSVVFIRFSFFFFFFFLPFSRDVLFRLTRVESWTMVTRLKERERVIINTWKIAVVILETGGDGLLV